SAQQRSIANLGLRELAREAGLHHTAIYRHFSSIEDVALALVEKLSSQLRADLRQARRAAVTDGQDFIRVSNQHYFDYVLKHPQGVIFCAREVHGALPSLRQALQTMLDEFAADSAEDLAEFAPAGTLPDRQSVLVLTRLIAEHTLFSALDYLEYPQHRAQIVNRAHLLSEWLLAGSSSTRPRQTG
ncbi:MAG: TetR family transcriptional regulator, partial [Oceanococcaceae bacterium]